MQDGIESHPMDVAKLNTKSNTMKKRFVIQFFHPHQV